MGKKSSLSETKRAQIVVLSEEGYSEREISAKMQCSKTAVHTALKNFNNYGSYKDLKRSGRPKKTSPRDDLTIKRIAVNKFFEENSCCAAWKFWVNICQLIHVCYLFNVFRKYTRLDFESYRHINNLE